MANCVKCGRQMPGLGFGKRICVWCRQHEAAQRGEESAEAVQPVMAVPWARREATDMIVTKAIFGINAAVFLGMVLSGVSITDPTMQQLVDWGANWGPRTMGGEWWRLLTCVFLHIGIIHIGFNMWCLWDLGRLCESLYGHWTFGAVYLISGVAASVASVAWHPGGVSAGASGAIFGIAGALIASFYLGEFSLPRAAISGTLRSVVMFAGYNLVFGAMMGRTDNAAHVGGLVSGLILGALIAKVAPGGELLRRAAVLALVAAVVAGGVGWLRHSRSYMLHAQHGSALLEEKNADGAIAELQTAIGQRPNFAAAHFELARAYSAKRDFAKAENELKRVIELEPKSETAHAYLGFTYVDEQKTQQARDEFRQILARDPNRATGHFGMGTVAFAEGDWQGALEEYKDAARLDPASNGVNYELGRTYLRLKMYDDAVAAFRKELEVSGEDYDVEMALAAAYDAKRMKNEALEVRQKAEKLKAGR
jgi:rhomboid protease GluP